MHLCSAVTYNGEKYTVTHGITHEPSNLCQAPTDLRPYAWLAISAVD